MRGFWLAAFLGWLESHTGIPKLYLASAILFCLLLLVFRGTGLGVVSVCVGFLWPLHMSLKTIENCTSLFEEISGDNRHRHTEEQIKEKRGEIVGQLRQWLVYWVVYGLFNVFEQLSDFSLSWLPVYHPLKLVFLLWCFLPQYQGSQLVFDILVRPVLIRHESAIEQGVETASQGPPTVDRGDTPPRRETSNKLDRTSLTVVFAPRVFFSRDVQRRPSRPCRAGEEHSTLESDPVSSTWPERSSMACCEWRVCSLCACMCVLVLVVRSSLDQSRGVAPSGLVHARVVAIESGQLGQISEDAEGEPHAGSDEGQSFSAFEAASRVAEASQRK